MILQVLSYVDDVRTLARAAQVSKLWRDLLSDDMAWKIMCDKHAYRRLSDERWDFDPFRDRSVSTPVSFKPIPIPQPSRSATSGPITVTFATPPDLISSFSTKSFDSANLAGGVRLRPSAVSYRSHFKQRYMVETAWRHGGRAVSHHITPDQGVVTSLHLTPKYIVVALDNAKIHIFNPAGDHQKTLSGHVMGVWAMVPWGDILVSGGCDRDVRVWDMATGCVSCLSLFWP